jgi:proteic killer suppression protein
MIGSIRHKGLADLHWKSQSRGVMQSLVKRLRQVLALLETANTVDDMNIPGLRLHALKGDRRGFYSVSVSGNWRIIFRLINGNAEDVNLIDYH